jgi:flagellar biosynthetic protein FliO
MRGLLPSKTASGSLLTLLVLVCYSSLPARGGEGAFDIGEMNQHAYRDMPVDTAAGGGIGAATRETGEEPTGMITVILRTIGYLVLIIALIVGMLWGMRRLGMSGSSRVGGGSMDLLEVLPVGQNRSIMLVRVVDAVLVLAQTAQHIAVVERIEGDKAVELIASSKGGTSMVPFKDMFNNFVNRVKKS